MARVVFCLACSMSWCNTLESVFKTFDPAERISFRSLSARANSRSVCRRPCGVAYQSASSASDLNFGTSVDVRGIIPPVGSVHFVSSDGAEQPLADSENDGQIAAGCGSAETLPAILAMNGIRWNDDMGAAHDFFNFEGSDSVAQDMTHVRAVPIEAFDLVQHASSIYGQCIYTQKIGVVRSETKAVAAACPPLEPAPVRSGRCARPASGRRCAPCDSPRPGIAELPAFR